LLAHELGVPTEANQASPIYVEELGPSLKTERPDL
jgi:hypothetical protein